MTLSIEVISCGVVHTRLGRGEHATNLVQDVDHIPERPLDAVSALIPVPIAEEVIINRFVVDQYVLAELCRVVVEEVAEGVDGLCDSRGEGRVSLWELL